MNKRILLGAIADDFTGATDLANILVRGGMRIGADHRRADGGDRFARMRRGGGGAQVAHHPGRGRRQAIAGGALDWLKARRVRQVFFKVCSTFDSTDAGNIGQVADALLDALGEKVSVVCPAYPANRRTLFHGHLFVGDVLLSDSPMRNHPLTPMTDANLVRVLGRQSRYPVGLVPWSKSRRRRHGDRGGFGGAGRARGASCRGGCRARRRFACDRYGLSQAAPAGRRCGAGIGPAAEFSR